MKLVSTALLAAGLVALSACGGAETNVTANNSASDVLYNVVPDDENLLIGNDVLVNDVGLNGAVDAGNAAVANGTGNGL